MEIMSTGYALLSIQSALLAVVTPQLRAVVIEVIPQDDMFYIRIYYDGQASEKLIDLWQCMTTEASAHLGVECRTDDVIERLDYPLPIPVKRGTLAYLRKEPYSETKLEPSSHKQVKRAFIDHLESHGSFTSPVDHLEIPTYWGVLQEGSDSFAIIPAKPTNYPIPITPVAYALLGMQRALLGIVIPELRSVIVDADPQVKLLFIRFYYEGTPSEEILNEWEYAITKTSADMGPEYTLDGKVEKVPYPKCPPFRGRYAYLRREKHNDLGYAFPPADGDLK